MLCLNNVPGADKDAAEMLERFLEWLYAGDRFAICTRERGGFSPLARSESVTKADEVRDLAEAFLAEVCR